ncbi:MAG: AmmeMemoRadiSam system radical SAM enzyme [Acidobacteria bacterium]|nr:AmmeMemoRadiSam system radical SAM enzyme [Acidobacteriota bacterium]
MKHPARWWRAESGRVRCELCPRLCLLAEGQAGYCGVRHAEGGALFTEVYGGHGGLCVDPIEKKPLYHVLPGSRILSFGMAGCVLGCDFCQNWRMSRMGEAASLRDATPEGIAEAALASGCEAVAFTYNEPVLSAEWCLAVAAAARGRGLLTAAVSSAYVAPGAWGEFFGAMDAVNLDLKAFSDAFYRRRCKARLAPVLAGIEAAKRAGCWVEITSLLIPGENDSERDLRGLSCWVARTLGVETPLHFTAFHPDFQLRDKPPTPVGTLRWAREMAMGEGLRHVYTGNVRDAEGGTTRCEGCGMELIARDGFQVRTHRLQDGGCPRCGRRLSGIFSPGEGPGDPRRRRIPPPGVLPPGAPG